jgi:hypothetical protein
LEETCPAGNICVGGSCMSICDPSHRTCSGDAACVTVGYYGNLGACTGQCLPSGDACANNGDCCSGNCWYSSGKGSCY